MNIRPMQHSDLGRITDLEKQCFTTPWSKQLFEDELAREDTCRWLVLELEGSIAGYMGWWRVMDEAHITNLAVDALKRKRGLGRILVKAVLQQALEQGCSKATLEVRLSNQPAVSLYRSFGFTEAAIRPGYYSDNGEDALLMWLNPIPQELENG